MKIIVACEYSGVVGEAFASLGHEVLSCDLLPGDNIINRKHYQGSIYDIDLSSFDMLIGFPPCTYLCKAQYHLYNKDGQREQEREAAIKFFNYLWQAHVDKIALENPIGYLANHYRQPDQITRAWHFGEPYSKDICLWLKNLPPLISTHYNTIRKPIGNHTNGRMTQQEKSKIKSKFFKGVADAMATQWG